MVLGLITLLIPFVAFSSFYSTYYSKGADTAVVETANFLNRQNREALVESYESELFFLLDHPIHYPPNQLNADLVLDKLGHQVNANYDPLAADPDYLVVGDFGRHWQLYDKAIADNEFRLLQQIGRYDIYEHIRE